MVIKDILRRAEGLQKRIIFPEGSDERIIKAAKLTAEENTIIPILVGDESIIRQKANDLGVKLENFEIIEPSTSTKLEQYVSLYSELSKIPERTSKQIIQQSIFYSAIALKSGDADGMIGGLVYTSGDFIAVCNGVIGLRKEIKVPSSFFIMEIPGYDGGENGFLLFADASVNPNPTVEELADIAISTGHSAKMLLGWEPRVAMLSFSTKGSADHPDVTKVVNAVKLAQKKAKEMKIEGEFQADTALVFSTAKRKIKADSIGDVAGRANILIFPDLDAGNIAYKLTQILAKANAYGPILQGFAKPLSDLSRGATVGDIVGVIAIVSVIADRWEV
ncbi:MAG: phosphate acyltransferase [Promethearchaeota archaeon]